MRQPSRVIHPHLDVIVGRERLGHMRPVARLFDILQRGAKLGVVDPIVPLDLGQAHSHGRGLRRSAGSGCGLLLPCVLLRHRCDFWHFASPANSEGRALRPRPVAPRYSEDALVEDMKLNALPKAPVDRSAPPLVELTLPTIPM